ncbi:hypothetical protein [Halobellus inordinatus]|uniref:hypothetical protein n=1 Tax=Halobellus inordinatus TaxID=1126236 RepID=UPI00210877DD|nr:hypothetical protein [Halobellus inordinatus]
MRVPMLPIQLPGSGGGGSDPVPDFVYDLEKLAPVAGTLVTIASNPRQWLRNYVFDLIAEWIVGGILDSTQYVLGWIIFAYERTRSILLTAIPPLQTPFDVTEDAVIDLIRMIFDVAIGVAHTAGFAGPPATAFAIVLLGTVIVATIYAIVNATPAGGAIEGALGAFKR